MTGVVAPLAAVVGLDRGADGEELGGVGAPLLELDLEAHADDAVGAEHVGLGLHAAHRQLARVVHGLGQDVQFLVLAPPAHLEAAVVDRGAEHEAERGETGLLDQQELVDREVGGEDVAGPARLQLGEPVHRVLRHSQSGRISLSGHRVPFGFFLLSRRSMGGAAALGLRPGDRSARWQCPT